MDIDREIAEKVMGYDNYKGFHWTTSTNQSIYFRPSTNISDAWLVVEKMRGQRLEIEISNFVTDKEWSCAVFNNESRYIQRKTNKRIHEISRNYGNGFLFSSTRGNQ